MNNLGKKAYHEKLDNNLFQPLTIETVSQLLRGDGNEMKGYVKKELQYRAKINAIHSSSVIALNFFQYWQNKNVIPILFACKLCARRRKNVTDLDKQSLSESRVMFEQKFLISNDKHKFPRSPNIDVVINETDSRIFAIESKFTEPYRFKSKRPIDKLLNEKYLDNSFWNGLSNLYNLAERISCQNENNYLDSAQLIKHILGLKKTRKDFRLLYIWYDVVGDEGVKHREEIEIFKEIAKKDNVKFSHITYQEVIARIIKGYYAENKDYCDYLSDRYL